MSSKVIPINSPDTTRQRLINAVGLVLARYGFNALSVDKVCMEAGVNRSILHRYFKGLPGLLSAFADSQIFWPSSEELLKKAKRPLAGLSAGEQMSLFFKCYIAALRERPMTLEILAWESLEWHELSRPLEEVRIKTALEFFEKLEGDIPDHLDLTAIVLLFAAASNFLAVRSRTNKSLGGVDLRSPQGWRRIESAIDLLLKSTLDNAQK